MAAIEGVIRTRRRGVAARAVGIAAACAALAASELLVAEGRILAGAVANAALLLVLANVAMLAASTERDLLVAFAVVPLARILSLVMPLGNVSPLYWNVLAGIAVAPAVLGAIRASGLSCADLRLRLAHPAAQLMVAVTGVPLGLVGYALLRPEPVVGRLEPAQLMVGSAILIVFAAAFEELLFRGLLQRASRAAFGRAAPISVNVVFGLTAISSGSAAYVVFACLMGCWFSYVVDRWRSLWGVIAAHAVVAIGIVLVWPNLLG